MLRHLMQTLAFGLLLCQLGLAQDSEKAAQNWRPGPAGPVAIDLAKAAEKPSNVGATPPAQPPAIPQPQPQPHQWSQPGPWFPQPQMQPPQVQPFDRLGPQVPPPAPPIAPCVELDVLIGCVVFDENGELRVAKAGAEPEVNRAGTIGVGLAAKLNEQRDQIPAGVSPGAAGANFLLEGLAGEQKLQSLEQFQLRLIANGSQAQLQSGQHVPRITGTSTSSRGQTNQVSMESLGTMIGASAEITKTGKIALSIEVERSAFGPAEEGTPLAVSEGEIVRTPRMDTTSVKTLTSLADGRSIVLTSSIRAAGAKVTETFVVVTATVVKH